MRSGISARVRSLATGIRPLASNLSELSLVQRQTPGSAGDSVAGGTASTFPTQACDTTGRSNRTSIDLRSSRSATTSNTETASSTADTGAAARLRPRSRLSTERAERATRRSRRSAISPSRQDIRGPPSPRPSAFIALSFRDPAGRRLPARGARSIWTLAQRPARLALQTTGHVF